MPSDPAHGNGLSFAEAAPPVPKAKRRFHTRTREYLKTQLRDRTAAELAMLAKGLAVALVTIVPTILTVIVISKVVLPPASRRRLTRAGRVGPSLKVTP